jgi:serine protease
VDLAGAGYRLSGTLSVPAGAAVDSDLNDVNQLGRTRNNDLAAAQALTAPVWLVGSVNRPGTGPIGSNQTAGDTTDAYALDLQAGDLVELAFVAGEGGTAADLDLYILSTDGALTGSSDSTTSADECVRVTQTGRYYLKIEAFRQASAYTLRAGPATTRPTGCTATTTQATFEPGELVAQGRTNSTDPATNPTTQTAAQTTAQPPDRASPLAASLATPPRRPHLITLPATSLANRKNTLAAHPAAALDARLDTLRQAKALRASGAYDYVEPNWHLRTAATLGTFPPDDLHHGEQRWHHGLIALPAAINRLQALPVQPSQRPVIAVIDTGVMLDHPDLQPQLVSPGRTFLSDRLSGDRNLANGDDQRLASDNATAHGTHVAGTAAAATFNGIGVAGVAPMARLLPLNVLGRQGAAKTSDILEAMRYAAGLDNNAGVLPARRADVINLSMGSPGACSLAFQDTINRVRAAGSLVVAAAGSLADNTRGQAAEVQQPANCAGVIAVGAVDSDRQPSPYANTGAALVAMAPGGDLGTGSTLLTDTNVAPEGIFSTLIHHTGDGQRVAGVGPLQGSSMAAPQVSGVLALMRHVNPALTPEDIDALFAAGQLTNDLGAPGRDHQHGWGMINALKAVNAALQPHDTSGAGTGTVTAGAATLGLQPARLDLGSLRSTATLDLVVTGGRRPPPAGTTVTAVRSSHPALTLRPGIADTRLSLHRQLVEVDRRLLPRDGTHSFTVTFTLNTGAVLTVPVSVERMAGSASSGPGFGPAYVTLSDPDNGHVLHTLLVHAVQGRYRWQLDGYRRARVVVRAGTDPDNRGHLCGVVQPCGVWTAAEGQVGTAQVLTLDGDRSGLDLVLSPSPQRP